MENEKVAIKICGDECNGTYLAPSPHEFRRKRTIMLTLQVHVNVTSPDCFDGKQYVLVGGTLLCRRSD
jgi:hypothetical protein